VSAVATVTPKKSVNNDTLEKVIPQNFFLIMPPPFETEML
jgi:hypothetical protein